MTGLLLLSTSASKVASVTALVAPICDHTFRVWSSIRVDGLGFLGREPALGVDRRRAAAARRGDRLTVGVVDDIAGGEDTLDGSLRGAPVDQEVALGIGRQLS